MNLRPVLSALALTLALAACGRPPAQPAATQAPAALPPTVTAPTTAPTLAAPAGVLPAPLLFIDGGNQIARLEADGTTRTTLVTEQTTIIDVAVAPDGATIAYVTVDAEQRSVLVRIGADGSDRSELAVGIIRGVTVAADGSVQAGALFDTTVASNGETLRGGAWSFPADGGAPTLLVAATEPTGSGDSLQPGSHYQPLAWSPDGSKLLLTLTMNMGPDGPGGDIGTIGLAVYDTTAGQARDLLPMGQEPLCVSAVWSRTGDAVFCANGAAIGPPTPALWRLDLGDGSQQTLIPAGDVFTPVLAPADLADGLYVLVGTNTTEQQRFTPERINSDGNVTPLLPTSLEAGYGSGLWAPDGSGVLVERPGTGDSRVIVWQPLGPGEPVELLSGGMYRFQWAGA